MIAHRPAVLAHERFMADRENFSGLDLAARFERIERTNLWGAATSVSGLGSEDRATAAIREALPGMLRRLGARSLLDAPCGDATWISTVVPSGCVRLSPSGRPVRLFSDHRSHGPGGA